MRLGAQLFSLRTFLNDPKTMMECFCRLKEMGYEVVQFSGASTANCEYIQEVSQASGLPIVCTHVSFERLTEETDALIREHRTFDCPVIGLGAMPTPFRGSRQGLEDFLKQVEEPIKKIRAAGFGFAYHNHDFEFEKLAENQNYYDYFIENCPDWQLILDTYWVEFAGHSAAAYLQKIQPERLVNVHFKDMAKDEKRSICSCGAGCLNFAELTELCRSIGVKNVMVEQDNAVDFADPMGQMESSLRHLRPLFA